MTEFYNISKPRLIQLLGSQTHRVWSVINIQSTSQSVSHISCYQWSITHSSSGSSGGGGMAQGLRV